MGNLTAQLTQLTERRSLQVVPASEVRSQHLATAEQARQSFGANLVMEGNTEHSGKLVRVNYTLVDTSTRRALRADTITAPRPQILSRSKARLRQACYAILTSCLRPGEKQAFETYWHLPICRLRLLLAEVMAILRPTRSLRMWKAPSKSFATL